MLILRGRRIPGKGLAAGTVAAQLGEIAKEFPEITHCHHGTINIELASPLLVLTPDHRTKPIRAAGGEVFDLLRIEIEVPSDTPRQQAWLYLSHWTIHRQTPTVHEVIAPRLHIPDKCECVVHISRPFVELPYPRWPAVVVF